MSPQLVMAIGYLLTEAVHSGLTIQQTLKEVEETGVVPPERWEELKAAFDDATEFWGADQPPPPAV